LLIPWERVVPDGRVTGWFHAYDSYRLAGWALLRVRADFAAAAQLAAHAGKTSMVEAHHR